jgi:hypothetical protein
VMPFCVEDAHRLSVLSGPLGLGFATRKTRVSREPETTMRSLRQWLRRRKERRLAVVMRDALLPLR